MITLTKSAANQVKKMLQASPQPDKNHLRLFVKSGGCSGHEYGMCLDVPKTQDQIFSAEGVDIVVDNESYAYLKGSNIDFDDGLHGKGFHLSNPNAKNTCGCGKSFN